MKARAGKVNATTSRTCVTKEDLDRGDLLKGERENCSRKVIETARRFEVEENIRRAGAVENANDVRIEIGNLFEAIWSAEGEDD